jgi:alkaline phosphatase
MAKYIDGFVLTIKKDNRAAYKKMAQEGKSAWMKFGALSYMECRADDVTPPHVAFTFPKMAKAKEDEEVWFSFITFSSKKQRNEVNKKVMEFFEKKYAGKNKDMPFDMKRFAYGGFTVEVEG